MTVRRKQAEQRGRAAEDEAAAWLERQGWDIVDRRRKTPQGEIDLICARPGLIAFVEVKWRKTAAELDFAIDEYRLRRVAAATAATAHEYALHGEDIRIDVILLAPDCQPRHIENAWMP